MATEADNPGCERPTFGDELRAFWSAMPDKGAFGILCVLWLALFHFYGNSTLGYVNTPSLFGWMDYSYSNRTDDEHGYYLPLLVLYLLWWKKDELQSLPKRVWWPGVVLVLLALLIHLVGFQVQQTRLSIVAFYFGLYALGGVIWGGRWLIATFFPFFLFGFGVPLGNKGDALTQPLRQMATDITAVIAQGPLGIQVIQNGTTIFDPSGRFSYEIAAACSGLRSLTAITLVAIVFAFLRFTSWWRRAVMIGAAVPLAIGSNVFRLTSIIISAEAFGQQAGNFVHDNALFSLLPYLPAFVGLFLLGWALDGRLWAWFRRWKGAADE
jgi:exosortase